MSYQPVHIHRRVVNRNFHLVLLFLPSLIFTIIIFIYLLSIRIEHVQIASTNEPKVLGDETKGTPLDK